MSGCWAGAVHLSCLVRQRHKRLSQPSDTQAGLWSDEGLDRCDEALDGEACLYQSHLGQSL